MAEMMRGRVSWFKLEVRIRGTGRGKRGRVSPCVGLEGRRLRDRSRGTTLKVKVERQGGRQRVVEVLEVDTATALPGEPAPVHRKASIDLA